MIPLSCDSRISGAISIDWIEIFNNERGSMHWSKQKVFEDRKDI
jgi:hypothetical protein